MYYKMVITTVKLKCVFMIVILSVYSYSEQVVDHVTLPGDQVTLPENHVMLNTRRSCDTTR